VSTALARRLGKLEATAKAGQLRLLRPVMSRLTEALTPEHRQPLRDWAVQVDARAAACMAPHVGAQACLRCCGEVEPPALVRAISTLVAEHINRGTPVLLPPEIAQVYVDHTDAIPEIRCTDCGYLLPARAGRLAYAGPCPGCRASADGRRQ
jgi:hypothetical protein